MLILTAMMMLSPLGDVFAADSSEVGFSVKAVLPENQNDTGVSYFDLRMVPGQEQDLVVQVVNSGDATIEIEVEAISASTNENGVIDYQTIDMHDETLETPFSDIASVQDSSVLTIAAHSSKSAVIHVVMPQKQYDGTVLGGLVFSKRDADASSSETMEQESESDITIKNVYSYVIGVKLTETDVVVSPDFEAVVAAPELTNYRVGVTHHIRNKEAAIAKDVTMDIEIYQQGGDTTIQTAHEDDISMAPNSVIPYAIPWDGPLDPGSYVSHVTMTMEDRQWEFDMPFEVSASMAASINSGSVDMPEEVPWWAIAVIILLAILIILATILLVLNWRKRKALVS